MSSFEHGNRFSSHSQANSIHNPSNFISESDKTNLFSFNSNELDIFDFSTDIYDSPQTNIFPSDNSFISDQQSSSNVNDSKSNHNPAATSILQEDKNQQVSNHSSTNIFDPDVVASINLLSYKNKTQKNEDFSTLKDYDTSPEGYIDYNKTPETDDILTFERRNLHIKNHQIKLKDDEEIEKGNKSSKSISSEPFPQKKSFFGLLENSFFTDLPENVFDDTQNQQNQKQYQVKEQPQSFPHDFIGKSFEVQNQTLFTENQQPQLKHKLGDQLQIQSTPQFNINSLYSTPNLQFPSPSSTNDLYQYQSNANSILHPTIQYQSQFQISDQRSSTAPIPVPLMMNNSITSSTSTIPIDFSMGSATTDDANTLLALSNQSFNMAMSNRSLVFQPMTLSFEPYEYWLFQERSLSFNDLVCKFFRHNKTNFTKFMYKLYDMLRITTVFPSLRQAVGVYFLNDVAISVDKYAMINMLSLNPKNVDGSLFHKQGNFPTHGFIEVTSENYKEAGFTKNPVYKSKSIRILFNKDHKFVNKVMSTAELDAIAYENKSKKTYKRK